MAAYILYTDRDTKFECRVKLQGASLRKAEARLVVESEDMTLLFTGQIASNGKCVIPIKKMGQFMDEATSGEMRLEIIAEDVYFQPWQSSFTVDASRKLTVEVMRPSPSRNKPTATVRLVNDPMSKLTRRIIQELKSNGVTINNIRARRPTVIRCINEQIKRSRLNINAQSLIGRVVKSIAK